MEEKKFADWEYMLKYAIYTSLIDYADSNGHSIPCKTRGEIEDRILRKFKEDLSKRQYSEPSKSPKQIADKLAEALESLYNLYYVDEDVANKAKAALESYKNILK